MWGPLGQLPIYLGALLPVCQRWPHSLLRVQTLVTRCRRTATYKVRLPHFTTLTPRIWKIQDLVCQVPWEDSSSHSSETSPCKQGERRSRGCSVYDELCRTLATASQTPGSMSLFIFTKKFKKNKGFWSIKIRVFVYLIKSHTKD